MRITKLLIGLLLAFTARAQEYATARVMESQFKKASFIHISYESGEQETIDLIDWNLMSGVGNVASTMQENQRTFTKMIGTMRAKGYELTKALKAPRTAIY